MRHDIYTDRYIRSVLEGVRTIALVGISNLSSRPSWIVGRYLIQRGYEIVPINPRLSGQKILGRTVFPHVGDVPMAIDMVDIFRRPSGLEAIVDESLAIRPLPKVIWMQFGLCNDELAARAEASGIQVIMNRCPKIEYGRFTGENSAAGVYSRMISSRPRLPIHVGHCVR